MRMSKPESVTDLPACRESASAAATSFAVLLALKLVSTVPVGEWSWWWVTLPLWAWWAFWAFWILVTAAAEAAWGRR